MTWPKPRHVGGRRELSASWRSNADDRLYQLPTASLSSLLGRRHWETALDFVTEVGNNKFQCQLYLITVLWSQVFYYCFMVTDLLCHGVSCTVFPFLATIKHNVKPIVALGDLMKRDMKTKADELSLRSNSLMEEMESIKELQGRMELSHTENLSLLQHKHDEQVVRPQSTPPRAWRADSLYSISSMLIFVVFFSLSSSLLFVAENYNREVREAGEVEVRDWED